MPLREKFFWRLLCTSGLFLIAGTSILAQAPTRRFSPATLSDPIPDLRFDSISWYYRAACKGLAWDWLLLPAKKQVSIPVSDASTSLPDPLVVPPHKPFLTVHGNVQYNFLYRSFVDTPFSQNNFQQHTIQTSLNITIRDRLPLRVNLSQRISNSPYFKNFLDLNAQFDRFAYVKNVRQQLLDRISRRFLQHPDLSKAEQTLKELTDRYNNLKKMLSSDDVRQKIVEEREKALRRQSTSRFSLNQPALPDLTLPDFDHRSVYKMKEKVQKQATTALQPDSSYSQYIQQKKKELDSLQQRMTRMQTSTDSLRNALNKTLIQVNQQVYKATSLAGLQKIATDNNLIEDRPRGVERFLAQVKSLGIGRSVVNYSELTAWNVSLTGFSMEYNPGIYTALAVGKIDYGFRDFLGRNTRQKGQNFLMGRIGLGNIEKKAIIFSAFTGRRYSYGSLLSDTISNYVNLTGYSVEAIFKKDEHTSFSAEVAKTTKPVSGQVPADGMKSLWQFQDNANLGISLKGQTMITRTATRLSGFYRKTGESFQSFSLFTYNTDQTSWSVKVDQPFLKNKINVIGSLRRNDFLNPFTEKTFKTSSIFKSVQVNVRFPKWPVLSVGYYPGTQLYIVDKERIRENAYYLFNGSLLYQYAAGNARMLSSILYNRYAGKGTDSGFIAYAGTTYMASQTIMIGKAQLQGVYVYTNQEQLQYYTLEANGDYWLATWLQAGAGIKYNRVAGGKTYMGSRGSLAIDIKKLGGLRLQYEKSFLPTIWQTLYPVETGTLSWFKYF